jgi:hypothetical protein
LFPDFFVRTESLLFAPRREIVAGNIDLALSCPQNVAVRLVLAQTLRGLNRLRPNVVMEFRDKIAMLRAEHPLAGRAQHAAEQLFDSIFVASPA